MQAFMTRIDKIHDMCSQLLFSNLLRVRVVSHLNGAFSHRLVPGVWGWHMPPECERELARLLAISTRRPLRVDDFDQFFSPGQCAFYPFKRWAKISNTPPPAAFASHTARLRRHSAFVAVCTGSNLSASTHTVSVIQTCVAPPDVVAELEAVYGPRFVKPIPPPVRSKARRRRIAPLLCQLHSDTVIPFPFDGSPYPPAEQFLSDWRACDRCGKSTPRYCQHCTVARYCCRRHQIDAWADHKPVCSLLKEFAEELAAAAQGVMPDIQLD